VAKQTQAAESRIQAQISPYGEVIRASTLAALARNGDGTAFDMLMGMTQSPNTDIQQLAISTRNAVYMEYAQAESLGYLQQVFRPQKNKDELLKIISDPQPLMRKAAADGLCNLNEKSSVSQLLEIMRHDPTILVRQAALSCVDSPHRTALQPTRHTGVGTMVGEEQGQLATKIMN
jgi:HEAT repeats